MKCARIKQQAWLVCTQVGKQFALPIALIEWIKPHQVQVIVWVLKTTSNLYAPFVCLFAALFASPSSSNLVARCVPSYKFGEQLNDKQLNASWMHLLTLALNFKPNENDIDKGKDKWPEARTCLTSSEWEVLVLVLHLLLNHLRLVLHLRYASIQGKLINNQRASVDTHTHTRTRNHSDEQIPWSKLLS